jgi:signal transduction histidine kinase/ActR/RegA family two-component response regulator
MEVSTDTILCTEELQRRPARPADFEAENHALSSLMHALAESPDGILQTMAETMLDTFNVGSAGCSILADKGDGLRFYWPAIAGAWKEHVGGGTPRDFGPCGDVLDRNVPLLFRRPQRRYTYLQDVTPGIEECLLAPFYINGVAIGTIWLVAHDQNRRFDREDLRQLLTLTEFASSAYQAVAFAERMRSMNEALLLGALRQDESAEAEEKLNLQLRDEITERKAVEVALHQATQSAERASLSKSEFLANMSHELRTPLGSILGHAQLLELGAPLTEIQQRSVTQMQKAGWHLADIINDVLDLAQVEAGKLSVQQATVSLAEIMLACQAMMEPLAQARGITMSFPCLDRAIFVRGDPKRIKQVLINLLSNAIKYNRHGGSVVVDCPAVEGDKVHISVRDTGEGLTNTQVSQLFQLFNRLGQETLNMSGTGLGLVMTKHLTELMDGTIGVESTVGIGSIFWIELKHVPAPEFVVTDILNPIPLTASRRETEKTLLYVEDNDANFLMVQELIAHRSDIRLLSAHDGHEGIELAREKRPDVILLDIKLPDISGLRVAAILAADPATAHIPIIGCSALAMPQDISAAMDAGFFNYLTKPVNVRELMTTVDKAFAV